MKSPILRAQPSAGPKRWVSSIDGEPHEFSRPCTICDGVISEGQPISFFRGAWAHRKCAADALISGDAVNAWLALGSDLARYPRGYNVSETRVIVDQLLRMAARMEPAFYDPDVDEVSA